MQAAKHWLADDAPSSPSRPRHRWLAADALMGTAVVVVSEVLGQYHPQPGLGQHDYVIEAFTSDAPDDALDVCVLPRRSWCGPESADAQRLNLRVEDPSVCAVTIAQQESRAFFRTGKCSANLPGEPGRCGIRGHPEVQDAPSVVIENHENEQPPECQFRHHELIACNDLERVVAQKCLPPLTTAGMCPRHHVLRDSRLGDVEAEEAKLRLDTRRSSE